MRLVYMRDTQEHGLAKMAEAGTGNTISSHRQELGVESQLREVTREKTANKGKSLGRCTSLPSPLIVKAGRVRRGGLYSGDFPYRWK